MVSNFYKLQHTRRTAPSLPRSTANLWSPQVFSQEYRSCRSDISTRLAGGSGGELRCYYFCSSYNEHTSGAFETRNFLAVSTQNPNLCLLQMNSLVYRKRRRKQAPHGVKIQSSPSKAKHKLSDPKHQGSTLLRHTNLSTSPLWTGWFAGPGRGGTWQDNTVPPG